MSRMFRPLMVIGCLIASSLAASAGEAAAPAPAMSDAFVGPWGGLYGGYGWGKPSGEWSLSSPDLAAQYGSATVTALTNVLDPAGSSAIATSGAVFGVQGGWNWKLNSNFVVGLEGDFGRYGLVGKYATAGGIKPFGNLPYTINESYSADWEGALRLRAGYAFNNSALAFVEAGPAIADLHYKSYFWDAGQEKEYTALQAVKVGVSLGGGVEFALTRNLTVSAEYLYSRFPSLGGNGVAPLTTGTTPNGTYAYVAHSSGGLNQNAVRIGLNYYFK
jgi:opacity protein-like surface antigen